MPGLTRFDAELLRCSICPGGRLERRHDGFACTGCGASFAVTDGILDLRADPDEDTQLDLDTYDQTHGVTDASARRLFETYERALAPAGGMSGRTILEIGAGTGNLTLGLARHGGFGAIHCGDISPRFLRRLTARVAEVAPDAAFHAYLFDANRLPFADDAFDFVVGHSILHHLLDFETTVRDARRVLRPGAIAVFGEPMMDSAALTYLMAAQILAADAMLPESRLSPGTAAALRIVAGRGAVKAGNLRDRGREVAAKEDKYVFPSGVMREIAARAGFSHYELMQFAPVEDFGRVIRDHLGFMLHGSRAVPDEIDQFSGLFDGLSAAYAPSFGGSVSRPFAFNVFHR